MRKSRKALWEREVIASPHVTGDRVSSSGFCHEGDGEEVNREEEEHEDHVDQVMVAELYRPV